MQPVCRPHVDPYSNPGSGKFQQMQQMQKLKIGLCIRARLHAEQRQKAKGARCEEEKKFRALPPLPRRASATPTWTCSAAACARGTLVRGLVEYVSQG
jgi:hypothetical protein